MLFANVGAAGNVILFMCSFVLWVVLATYTLALAGHCYLVVVQGTTAGIDRVEWPDEAALDWIIQTVTLGGLVAVLLVPVGFLSRALAAYWLVGQGPLRLLILGGVAVWLFFPVVFLSSLASSSPWQVLSGRVLWGLCRLSPQVLVFYILTGVLLAGALGLTYVALLTSAWYSLPVVAVAGSALWLIHARLMGRLGWLLDRLQDRRAPVASGRARPRRRKKPSRKRRATTVTDPWAVPDDEEELPAEEGYRMAEVGEQPKAERPVYLDPEPEPYVVAGEAIEPPSRAPREPVVQEAEVQREIDLRTRRPPNPPPDWPLFSGVFGFPLYPTSQKSWVWLSFWGLGTGGILRVVLSLAPF